MSEIVCVPHAGAGGSTFAPWRPRFGERLLAVTLPGREGRIAEPARTSIREMAADVAALLRPRGRTTVTLFGHSMGALVAYEAARLLRDERPGLVAGLVVSGCESPLSFRPENLSALQDDGLFLRAVARYGGLPDQVLASPDLLAYALPVLRSDLGACDGYRHREGKHLDLPVLALAGAGDPRVPVTHVEDWRRCTTGAFTLRIVAGGHFFVQSRLDEVITTIEDWMRNHEPLQRVRVP